MSVPSSPSKFARKLSSLPPLPTLDELRSRMEALLAPAVPSSAGAATADGGDAAPPRGADEPSELLLEFGERQLEGHGPVFLRRKRTPHGHRVGHAPLWAALRAESAVLSLLALDPALASVDFSRALYLDTETTGLLGGTGTVPFLLGLAYHDGDGFVMEQVLLRSFAEERAMLAHLAERLSVASCVVTYNGKTFDWPLLRQRAVMQRSPALRELPHLDLLQLTRRLHKHRLPSCSLKTVEAQILGRERVGDVHGADIAAIYWHYVRTGAGDVLEPVLEHNALDVLSMVGLVGLYGEALLEWVPPSDLALAARLATKVTRTRSLRDRFAEEDLARADASASAWSERAAARATGAREPLPLEVAAEVAKARGDKASALRRYEAALELLSAEGLEWDDLFGDASRERAARVRGQLVKLHEHFSKDFDRALRLLDAGTSEDALAADKRRSRLTQKLATARSAGEPSSRRAPAKKREATRATAESSPRVARRAGSRGK